MIFSDFCNRLNFLGKASFAYDFGAVLGNTCMLHSLQIIINNFTLWTGSC